jgi:hypothetical protein
MFPTRMFKFRLIAAGALCLLALVARGRAADYYAEKERVSRVYECCYGQDGYHRQFSGCRPCDGCDPDCEKHRGCISGHTCCSHCCCQTFMSPGSVHPTRCLDICLYRFVFPMSPWYSHPRDGILYPAYGSRSPSCSPVTH